MANQRGGILSLIGRAVRGRVQEFAAEARQQVRETAQEIRHELEADVVASGCEQHGSAASPARGVAPAGGEAGDSEAGGPTKTRSSG